MRKNSIPVFVVLIVWSVTFVTAQPFVASARQAKPKAQAQTIAFCDLVKKPEAYDGKEVKFRARYISTFEVSAFVHSDCEDNPKRTWVEFDDTSVSHLTDPHLLTKVHEQVLCCMWSGSSIRETEMVVTAVFHKPRNQGYGHSNEYCSMVTVKSVQEIGPTVTTRVPGFDVLLN